MLARWEVMGSSYGIRKAEYWQTMPPLNTDPRFIQDDRKACCYITVLALPAGKEDETAVYEILNTRPITKVSLLHFHPLLFLERLTDLKRPGVNANKADKWIPSMRWIRTAKPSSMKSKGALVFVKGDFFDMYRSTCSSELFPVTLYTLYWA